MTGLSIRNLLGDMSYRDMNFRLKIPSFAIVLAVAMMSCVTYKVVSILRTANGLGLHSYVASVCKAVEEYRIQNGQYPTNLSQIDSSTLDYDHGIPLSSLEYDIGESDLSVAYSVDGGTPVSCSRKLIDD